VFRTELDCSQCSSTIQSSTKEMRTKKKHMKTMTNIIQTAFAGFVLACVAALPDAQAVVPPPDGGYPGFNTAEGQNALFSLTTGSANTAVGWNSLFSNTEATQSVSTTRPLVVARCTKTRLVTSTRPRLSRAQQQHRRHQQHGHRSGGAACQH
jgi:hypothetical protein